MSFHHVNEYNNVGIINFFSQKTIFIIGSTGFMGKVFVEKLLRDMPMIKKVYLLVRANNAEAAKQRLKKEIIDSKLFKVVREKHGQSYEEFMWDKLVPVAGDLCRSNLGIDMDLACMIRNEANVIVHMGGNTKWNDRYDVSLEVNVIATSRLVDFAANCMELVLLLYVSSLYATRNIPGITFEKPIEFGKYRTEDGKTVAFSVEQLIETEMRIISEVSFCTNEEDQATEMIKLGIRRSKFYKMQNSYVLTKAMGEMLVSKLSSKLAVVISRPSLVESTLKEPFPGWVEGYKVLDPLILGYGTGQFEGFPANPYTNIDVVPVDMGINAVIVSMAKHGSEGNTGIHIYNVTSSFNPLPCHEFFHFCTEYFKSHPVKDSNGNVIVAKEMKFFESVSEFILAGTSSITGNLQNKLWRLAAIYEAILNVTGAWYDDTNTRKLLGEMSLDELCMFNFDFKCINWNDYFTNIHIHGLTQHVLRKKTLPAKL